MLTKILPVLLVTALLGGLTAEAHRYGLLPGIPGGPARTFAEHALAALAVGAVGALWLALAGYGLWQGGRFAFGARADAWPLVWALLVPSVLLGSVWHAWRNTFQAEEESE